jgi:hypothetical protein
MKKKISVANEQLRKSSAIEWCLRPFDNQLQDKVSLTPTMTAKER